VSKYINSEEWNRSISEYFKADDVYFKNATTDNTHVVQMLNSFIHNGPNGKHFSMVFEIMGVTLLEIIKRYNYKGVYNL
jgi:serine/threonine-protein kinase SRPK3